MRKDEAAKIFGVKENLVKHFKVQDPFNPWELEGYINVSEHLYGSMVIFKIDDYLTEQVIIGTPKQKYPFDRIGRFKFPSAKHINVYEKYDGTNILGYGYKLKDRYWITYKTRLTPVLSESKWGNWKKMWDEMLEKYSGLARFVEETVNDGVNPSFELFGSRNKHLIEYSAPLDSVLLFGMRNDIEYPEILDPEWFSHDPFSAPIARMETSIDSSQDFYSWYQKLRGELEAMNKFTEEDFIKGSEGYVWYLRDINGVVHQYKCKPQSVEDIHWASSGISKISIMTTVINAYEMTNDVTYEVVKELLLEEFEEPRIELVRNTILKAMSEVRERIERRDRVLALYGELSLDLLADKAGTMRALSKYFEKKEMSKVYTLLNAEVGKGI